MIFLEKYTFSKEKLLFKVASKVNTIKKLGFVIRLFVHEKALILNELQKHYFISDLISSSLH